MNLYLAIFDARILLTVLDEVDVDDFAIDIGGDHDNNLPRCCRL